jgi:Ca2+-binding RTX toxin-like protein
MRLRQGFTWRGIGVASLMGVVSLAQPAAAFAAHHTGASNGSAQILNRTLVIAGTASNDRVAVGPGSDATHVLVTVNGLGTTFATDAFDRIAADLGDGDDAFAESPSILADEVLVLGAGRGDDQIRTEDTTDVVFGNGGNDTISTGTGADLVIGGTGDDFVDGGAANDIVFLDHGRDVFQWDPGEGSDVIDGGKGRGDVMLFNGANGGDTASLSANGHRSLFLRDPGAIRMDMDGIERVVFNAFGGTDTTIVNNLKGTDVHDVDIDVGLAGGGDNVLDTVTVNGTDGADHVRVRSAGSTIRVAGLRAETSITGADARDALHINTEGGDDTVDVDASVTGLIGVTTTFGSGRH